MRSLLLLALLSAAQFAAAEELPDPTRPAIDLSAGGADADVATPGARPTEGLQTIIISPKYKVAVINGQTVKLGETYAGAKLVEIRENSIVLQGTGGTRVMELFPKVDIKKNKAAPQAEVREPGKTTGASDLPEKAAGETK